MHFGTHELYQTTLLPTLSYLQTHTDNTWHLPSHPTLTLNSRTIPSGAIPIHVRELLKVVKIPSEVEGRVVDFLTLRPVDLGCRNVELQVTARKLGLEVLERACWRLWGGDIALWKRTELDTRYVVQIVKNVLNEDESTTLEEREEREELWKVAFERGVLRQVLRYAQVVNEVDWECVFAVLKQMSDCEVVQILRGGVDETVLRGEWSLRVWRWIWEVGVLAGGRAGEGGDVCFVVSECACNGLFAECERGCSTVKRSWMGWIDVEEKVREAARREWHMGCKCLRCLRGAERAVLAGGWGAVCTCGKCR